MTSSADFDYVAPRSVDAALAALAEAGEGATLLAGGQTLVSALHRRLVSPTRVVDLRRIDCLTTITEDNQYLLLGAMATYHSVLRSELVSRNALLLHQACAEVADPQVRHRGTLGGALAHADPASDVCVAVLALRAELVIADGSGATQAVAATEFFLDRGKTVLSPGELLVQIRIPKHAGWGAHYEKFVRVAHQWAIVGVAATVQVEDGRIAQAQIGLANLARTPLRATSAERALLRCPLSKEAISAAVASVAESTDPRSDQHADADYRSHLAWVLTARAVFAAATRATSDLA